MAKKPKPAVIVEHHELGLALQVKLGSLAVHADEMLSVHGHEFDHTAIQNLLADPEVDEWLRDMSFRIKLGHMALCLKAGIYDHVKMEIQSFLNDPEMAKWLVEMDKGGLLPRKRN